MILKNNKAGPLHLGGAMTLMPGANEVDVEAFGKFKGHPVVEALLESGELEVERVTLAELKPDARAIALVNETLDRNLLGRWVEIEKRPAVKKAIEAQLAKLKVEAKTAETKTE